MYKTHYLVLDLKPDEELIAEYERYHQCVWPDIEKQILDSGVVECEIFRFANRLMMKLVVDAGFTFEKKEALDAGNERVQQWETLMDQFQSKIDGGTNGKWQLMTSIYVLKA